MSDRLASSESTERPGGVVPYHQTHRVARLPACPLCGWKSLVVQSYGRTQLQRSYYVTCEHCVSLSDNGTIEGPLRDSAESAAQAFTEAMRRYAASFVKGKDGEYDSGEDL